MSEFEGSIAIVGMSGRFPGAGDLNKFWQNLVDGKVARSDFSEEALRQAGVDPSLLSNPNYVKVGYVLDNVDLFDASFFDINRREAEFIDPQQRLFMECAWEALESSGQSGRVNELSVGVFGGTSMSTYLLSHLVSQRNEGGLTTGMQIQIGNDKDYLCSRVSYKLNLRGPSVAVQSACSTSLVAVCQAYDSLLNYQCDMALAGGVTVRVPQREGYLYEEGGIYSPDGYCRSFDERAQGTVFGSGVGVVALRRLEDAIEDSDRILAVVRGAAVNNDGSVKIGFTAPSTHGQSEVIAQAQAAAGIDPGTVQYIEGHGTATHLGDPIEVAALSDVFRASTDKKQFCAIGSVKSNLGHLEAAAGIAGLIKAVLALENKVIPPSLHFEQANVQIDFDKSPFYVNTEAVQWKANGSPRRAGVSSFGIGGTNAHVVLEEAPEVGTSEVRGRGAELLVLSGKSEAALSAQVERYRTYLADHGELSLEDVCYTADAGRSHFNHRLGVVASTRAELCERLDQLSNSKPVSGISRGEVAEGGSGKLAFMFTGQGVQYAGMAHELYEREPVFRAVLDRCAVCLQEMLERPLLEVIFESPAGVLDETGYTQPALYALETGLAALWASWGIKPDVVMGHSVGEYAAAQVAGVFELEDGARLIATRARLMQALPGGGAMVAVLAPLAQVQPLLTGVIKQVSVAALNGQENIVLSGEADVIERLCGELERDGVMCRRLRVSHAFHSSLMEPMLEAFREEAQRVSYQAPRLAVISNVTGEVSGERTCSTQ